MLLLKIHLAVKHSLVEQAARQRKKDTTEVTSISQDNSVADDATLDDDDLLDQSEMSMSSGKVKEPEPDEVETAQGLVGIHQAILLSIDKCGAC